MTRQLLRLSETLGPVDRDALANETPEPVAPPPPVPQPANGGPSDGLGDFFRKHEPEGKDRQADAALLFAYYLHEREGLRALEIKDLIRCCIRTGVDTRNFNRTLGTLTRRGLFEPLRHGHAYRLSEHGVAAVEHRLE